MFSPNNNHEDIAPDTPEMRSILIRSTPSMMAAPSSLQLPKIPTVTTPVFYNPSETKCNWELETIPKIPELYHVGRSRVSVSNCEGREIASRISECLRQQSLSITFEENTAVCETSSHTKFIVKIFEGDEHFIVEVQRRTGCSFTCQKLSRAILGAATGSKAAPESRTFTVPASILKKEQEREQEVNAEEKDIKNALRLIEQKNHDVQMLGMSALINITAKNNVSVEESSLNFLSKYILSKPHDENHHQSKLRLDALTVLANLLTQKSIQDQFVIENNPLQTLVIDLVHDNLNVAFQAARCMTAICRFYPTLKSNIASFGTTTTIDQAYGEGIACHKLLENEVQQLKLLSSIE